VGFGLSDGPVRSQELLAGNVDSDTTMVSRADLAGEVGSERYYGGLVYRKSAGMHVGRFVRGLAEAAARRRNPRACADDGPAIRHRRRP
jgi:glycine/D-amino acid oxidase-like deaminating enzyme